MSRLPDRRSPVALSTAGLAVLLTLVSSCDRAKAPVRTPSAPRAGNPAPAPRQAERAAQAEIAREVKAFVLTDGLVDAIGACDKDLADFWANPQEAQKIQGQLTLDAILKAIDETPRVRDALAAHQVTPRQYTIGTFAMLGGYSYEVVRKRNPKQVEGRKPPVNEATLAVVERRFGDVEKIVRPGVPQAPASASPPASSPSR